MGAEGEQAIPDRSISPETASRLCPEQRRGRDERRRLIAKVWDVSE